MAIVPLAGPRFVVEPADALSKLRELVEGHYRSLDAHTRHSRYAAHWWDHISRVVRNVTVLVESEDISLDDRRVLWAAALCHDIVVDENGKDDVLKSAERCRSLTMESGFDESAASMAASLIPATDRDVKDPETDLEKLLYIADKLDLFGLDGTARLIIQEAGEGTTVRDEVAQRIEKRQADWLDYMLSLKLGASVIQERAQAGEALLISMHELDPLS